MRIGGACPVFAAGNGCVAVPNTIVTSYDTLPPLTYLSPKSRPDRSAAGPQPLWPAPVRGRPAAIDLLDRSVGHVPQRRRAAAAIDDPPPEWFPLWSTRPRPAAALRVPHRVLTRRVPTARLKIGSAERRLTISRHAGSCAGLAIRATYRCG
jgi:hypothetical protein